MTPFRPRDTIVGVFRNGSEAPAARGISGGTSVMKKLLAAVALAGAATLMAAGTADTLAQTRKPAKPGTIELIQSKDGKFRFSVRDGDGKYLGGSAVGHATEKEAREA